MSDAELRYFGPDENGVEVEWEGADRWLVGTWQYDAIAGPIRALCARMVERLSHGDEDWAPLKVYALGDNGTLFKCSVHHQVNDDHREVHVMNASPLSSLATVGGSRLVQVASARFKV